MDGSYNIPTTGAKLYQNAQDFVPDLQWNCVVDGLLRLGEVSTLYGPSNCGKTALLGYMASRIISGRDFLGSKTRRGIVVHVAAESPGSVLERSVAYRGDIGSSVSPYLVRNRAVDFFQLEAVDSFIGELEALQRQFGEDAVLVIVDTLARSMGGASENDARDMTRIAEHGLQVATALNTHLLFVHHTGKQEDRGARGSSAFRGAVDTELALIPNPDSGGVVLQPVKQRNLPIGKSAQFKTASFILGEDENGTPRTTVMAVPMEAPVSTAPATKHDRRSAVLTALHMIQRAKGSGPVAFTTRDVVDALPAIFFTGVADADGRNKAINRLLTEFAKLPESRLSGTPAAGWRLASLPKSP